MKTETGTNCETPGVCKDSESVLNYWRKEAGGAGKEQSAWVISLDAEWHFLGCDQIAWRFYAQPVLLADEVLSAAKKRGAAEFVFVHHKPGMSPKAGPDDKMRARAIIQAGRLAKCEALDYLLIGEKDEHFIFGIFSLCHLKQFNADDPFAPKGKQAIKPLTP